MSLSKLRFSLTKIRFILLIYYQHYHNTYSTFHDFMPQFVCFGTNTIFLRNTTKVIKKKFPRYFFLKGDNAKVENIQNPRLLMNMKYLFIHLFPL